MLTFYGGEFEREGHHVELVVDVLRFLGSADRLVASVQHRDRGGDGIWTTFVELPTIYSPGVYWVVGRSPKDTLRWRFELDGSDETKRVVLQARKPKWL